MNIFKKKKIEKIPLHINENLSVKYLAVLEISNLINMSLSIEEILQKSVDIIVNKFEYESAVIYLNDTPHEKIVSKTFTNKAINKFTTSLIKKSFDSLFISYKETENLIVKTVLNKEIFQSNKLSQFITPVVTPNLANVLQTLSNTKSIISLPVIYRDICLGAIMFTKKTKENFDQDIDILNVYTHQIAIALQNSQFYENIQNQVKILETKNQDLESLYNLTSSISQSLVPEKVAQTAVNSIPQGKSMLGALLLNFNDTTGKIKVWAISENTIYDDVRKIVGDFGKLEIDVNNPLSANNPIVKTIKDGKTNYTNDMSDCFSPPIQKQVLTVVDKMLKIKSVVVYPVKSREKVVGAICYLLKERKFEELEENEKQLFDTYTYQISIALENANLFEISQATQKNLEAALVQVQTARKHEQDMVDILGHELRTPATVCRGNIELLKSNIHKLDGEPDNKIFFEKKIHSAYDAIMKETGLINELLTATKLDSGQLVITNEPIDLSEIVGFTFQSYSDIAHKQGLQLFYTPPVDPFPKTAGDHVRLGEVVDNLTSNAIKYTKKGSITLEIDHDKENVYFHIKDTGNGLRKDDVPTLFQKFRRLNNYIDKSNALVRPGGTGLGLYVSRGIIEAHGGKIWAESEGEGKGSTFSFSIPIKVIDGNSINTKDEPDMFKKLGLKKTV